jgi:hypothetical protein
MSLTRQQRVSVDLAGTVAVPSPFPAVGELRYASDPVPSGPVTDPAALGRSVYLTVSHRISPRLTITRTIPVDKVTAIFLPDDQQSVDLSCGRWLLAPDVLADVNYRLGKPRSRSKDDRWFLGCGIVYVPESAGLLLQVEVGMTAAESAEYYPPLPGDRSANYHNMCEFENPPLDEK